VSASVLGAFLVLATCAHAHAQPSRREAARAEARRVHEEGRYIEGLTPDPTPDPSDLSGSSDDPGREEPVDDVSTESRESGGAGPYRFPLPQWFRDLVVSLGYVLGGLFSSLRVLGPAIAVLMVGSLVALVIAVLVGLIAAMRFPARRARRGLDTADDRARQHKDPMLDELAMSAEAFAAAGRYGEAIHALFLRSLRRCVELDGRTEESTARELVAQVPDPSRSLMSRLLGFTELVWFGGRAASRDDYERALSIELELRA